MNNVEWRPIEDLSERIRTYPNPDLYVLAQAWAERMKQLRDSQKLKEFNERLTRQWAIETGLIERVYTLDRGITQMLIEQGLDASLIPHGASSQPAPLVVTIIKDQKEVIEGLFDFVAQRRELSTSYIKQMHQVFMRNQKTTHGLDEFGNYIEIAVIRGDWKKWPNNPRRTNGTIHEYCPPEQVASEMDRLIAMHKQHLEQGIPPEVEAAWLHHRFTQIHPFQDGNGRIARALASLVFLRNGWFPLVIINDIRDEYIEASEKADQGNLVPMIDLFAGRQVQSFRQALSISEDITMPRSIQVVTSQILERLRQRPIPSHAFDISHELEKVAMQRLQEMANELSTALREIEPGYWASVTASDAETDYWFKGQIIQIAKQFDYYANIRDYRAWVQLKIKEQRLVNLLLSFHGLGYEFSGIMAVSGFLEFRSGSDSEDIMPEGPYTVCTDIFQFSYRDQLAEVIERFKPWLEETLLIGLEQWRKQL
jgi:fido (protein-threonine AMPylation protein)